MPKGHEDFVYGSGRWPRPEDPKPGKNLSSELKRLEQSSKASETVATGSKSSAPFDSAK
jgi:hypothetical protein